VVRIVTNSIYIQKEALYKIENVSAFFKQAKQKTSCLGACKGSHSKNLTNISKFICSYDWHPCAVCKSPSLIKLIKEFQKTKMPLAKEEYFLYSKYKPFVCHNCFWDWYTRNGFWKVIPDEMLSCNTSIAITKVSEPLEEKI